MALSWQLCPECHSPESLQTIRSVVYGVDEASNDLPVVSTSLPSTPAEPRRAGDRGCSLALRARSVPQALRIRRRHVAKQDVEVEDEQGSEAVLEVDFEGALMRQQPIETLVEPRVVNEIGSDCQQIFEGGAAIP